MPHHFDLILTLTGGLSAALALGLITQMLRLSPIVGYLLAGVLVGPFTPGFVAHGAIAEQLAEVGVILLMFGVGLHFHLKELLRPVVIELNHQTVQELHAQGVEAIYGDAAHPDILERAGIARAMALIFAAAGTPAEAVTRVASADHLIPHQRGWRQRISAWASDHRRRTF